MKDFSKTQFFYIRKSLFRSSEPVACVAWRLDYLPGTGVGLLSYATSTRNPADNFNRKRARQIAEGRLDRRPEYSGSTEANNRDEVMSTIYMALAVNGTNARIRRGARMMANHFWREAARKIQETTDYAVENQLTDS